MQDRETDAYTHRAYRIIKRDSVARPLQKHGVDKGAAEIRRVRSSLPISPPRLRFAHFEQMETRLDSKHLATGLSRAELLRPRAKG